MKVSIFLNSTTSDQKVKLLWPIILILVALLTKWLLPVTQNVGFFWRFRLNNGTSYQKQFAQLYICKYNFLLIEAKKDFRNTNLVPTGNLKYCLILPTSKIKQKRDWFLAFIQGTYYDHENVIMCLKIIMTKIHQRDKTNKISYFSQFPLNRKL